MSLDTAILRPGESYATLARIRDVADLPEMAVNVPQWTEDGHRCVILIRALSFRERRLVQQKAKEDAAQIALLTCLYGIKEPRFSEAQLDILETRHPGAIDAIAETITLLGEYSADDIITHVRTLAGAEPAATDDRNAA